MFLSAYFAQTMLDGDVGLRQLQQLSQLQTIN